MAENKNQSKDPILNFLLKANSLFWRFSWALIKFTAIQLRNIIVFVAIQLRNGVVNIPVAYKAVRAFGKSSRNPDSPPLNDDKVQAALVREMDSAGHVTRVALYNNVYEATKALGNDFMSNRNFDKGIPDHTLQVFDVLYPKADLENIREEIANGELRNLDDFHTLNGVQEIHKGSLIAEAFKVEQGIPPFKELDNEGIFLYDIFVNNQKYLEEKAAWEEKAAVGNFSMQSILDCIEGRASIQINDFAEIMAKHDANFNSFLTEENAILLLDAISHHPEIHKMGGLSVDQIASLHPKHIQPINILVLTLISKTKKNPALAAKASRTITKIKTEHEWEPGERHLFEARYDDKLCTSLINKYADAGCSSVLRAMMATTYLKTLDDRNISQSILFQQQVKAYNNTAPVAEAMQLFNAGVLTPVDYTLPLYYGVVQRLSELRAELSQNESRYKNDLFSDNKQHLIITQEIQKYTAVLNNFHQSYEVQALDIQKMKNIRMAISSGKITNPDGSIKPEVAKSASWIIDRYTSNTGILAQLEKTLEGTHLAQLCQTKSEIGNFSEFKEWEKTPEELLAIQQQQELTVPKGSTEEITPVPLEEYQEQPLLNNKQVCTDFSSVIREYGINNIASSPDIIKSYAEMFVQAYPEIEQLASSDYRLPTSFGLGNRIVELSTPEEQKQLAICMAGISLGYIEGNNTADDVLCSLGINQEEINILSPQEREEMASNAAEGWMNLTDSMQNIHQTEAAGIPCEVILSPAPEELPQSIKFKI